MCDCVQRIKDTLPVKLPKSDPEYEKLVINRVTCESQIMLVEPNLRTGLYILFTLHHEPAHGKTKTVIQMLASHCPFCGEPYTKNQGENNAEVTK